MLQYVIKCYTILWNVTNRYEVLKSLCYKRNGRFIKLSLEMNEDECRIVTQSTETPSKIHSVLKLLKCLIMHKLWNQNNQVML